MTAVEVYGARGIKLRATRDDMENRRQRLVEIARDAAPASVRHVYYRAVVAGLVEKNQNGYAKVQRMVLELRRAGRIGWDWIEDTTRRAHHPGTYDSIADRLRWVARTYARNPWQGNLPPHVELWCESRSIAGALEPLVGQYAVPLYPLGGQSSDTFAYEAAQDYRYHDGRLIVLYAGDYDPAGLQIDAQLEGKLRTYSGRSDIEFRRLAITAHQAAGLQALGTKPKTTTWVDYAGERHPFVGQAIECEAVPTRDLRQGFATAIEQIAYEHYGHHVFAENRAIEAGERDQLLDLAGRWTR